MPRHKKDAYMKTLKETMQPLGGLAALKLFFKMEGVDIPSGNFQMFNIQAIPFKYMLVIEAIHKKHGIDLRKYLRQDKRVNNALGKIPTLYPLTLKKLKEYGMGKVASHINEERKKNDIFATPPRRFNHYSLEATLSENLTPKMKEFLSLFYGLSEEIQADEYARKSDDKRMKDILG